MPRVLPRLAHSSGVQNAFHPLRPHLAEIVKDGQVWLAPDAALQAKLCPQNAKSPAQTEQKRTQTRSVYKKVTVTRDYTRKNLTRSGDAAAVAGNF